MCFVRMQIFSYWRILSSHISCNSKQVILVVSIDVKQFTSWSKKRTFFKHPYKSTQYQTIKFIGCLLSGGVMSRYLTLQSIFVIEKNME